MPTKKSIYNIALLSLIILENLFFFILCKYGGYEYSHINAICFSTVSLSIGFVLIVKFYNAQLDITKPADGGNRYKRILTYSLFALAILWLAVKTNEVMHQFPIDEKMSDIFPTIEVLAKRFFVPHQSPYDRDALLHLGYNIPSTYMPMHWLPYTIAEYFKFDYRWITFSIWALSLLLLVWYSVKNLTLKQGILVIILMTGTYFLITDKYHSTIAYTVETMVAAYYILLLWGLNQKNGYLLGLSIGICLLSRYTLALWLPLYAFILYASGNRNILWKSIFSAIVFVTSLYIIPYLSEDWTAFYDAHMAYEQLSIGEWFHNNEIHVPYHLFKGTGLAQFFYDAYRDTDLKAGYSLLRTIMFITLLSFTLFAALWYWINKQKIDYRIFMMASFKIYLSLFLALIMVPYDYLFMMGNFASIAIFTLQMKYKPINIHA